MEVDPQKKLTTSQLSELNNIFNKYDKSHCGYIKKLDLFATLKKFVKFSDDAVNEKLDFDNFITFIFNLSESINVENELRLVFDEIDCDKDGFISKNELKNMLNYYSDEKFNDYQLNEMMKEIDVNNDGLISFDEFVVFMNNDK